MTPVCILKPLLTTPFSKHSGTAQPVITSRKRGSELERAKKRERERERKLEEEWIEPAVEVQKRRGKSEKEKKN